MSIPLDKITHLLAGIALAAFSLHFGLAVALGVVVGVAVIKEVSDHLGRGTPDINDALVTMVGGFMFIGWEYLVH